MAKQEGIELKKIQKIDGLHNNGFIAELFWKGRKIGICADYGIGKGIFVNLLGFEDVFYKAVKKHYKNNLDMLCKTDEELAKSFCAELLELHEKEHQC